MQRGLHVAIVESAEELLVDMAICRSAITAPRIEPFDEKPEDARLAASMQRGGDYQLRGEPAEIMFSRAGMRTIKEWAGWDGPASVKAVSAALRIEHAVLRKEGLILADERQTLADISVQAFVRLYESVTGFCHYGTDISSALMDIYGLRTLNPAGRSRRRFSFRKAKNGPGRYYASAERVIDEQRSVIYALRASTREADSGEGILRTWPEPAIAEAGVAELIERLVANASGQRELIRAAKLAYLDNHWWAHLARVRFLQGNLVTLYDSAADAEVLFKRDADSLFTACLKEMREYTLGHLQYRFETSG